MDLIQNMIIFFDTLLYNAHVIKLLQLRLGVSTTFLLILFYHMPGATKVEFE